MVKLMKKDNLNRMDREQQVYNTVNKLLDTHLFDHVTLDNTKKFATEIQRNISWVEDFDVNENRNTPKTLGMGEMHIDLIYEKDIPSQGCYRYFNVGVYGLIVKINPS